MHVPASRPAGEVLFAHTVDNDHLKFLCIKKMYNHLTKYKAVKIEVVFTREIAL